MSDSEDQAKRPPPPTDNPTTPKKLKITTSKLPLALGSNTNTNDDPPIDSGITGDKTATAGKRLATTKARPQRSSTGLLSSLVRDTTTTKDHQSVQRGKTKPQGRPQRSSAASYGPPGFPIPPPVPDEIEHIHPDEPRYCVCNEVARDAIVECDNEGECEKAWFHLSCVSLEDPPPKKVKWYCPECRVKLGIGIRTNGVVAAEEEAGPEKKTQQNEEEEEEGGVSVHES